MTDERWPRVKVLFQAAVERPTEERDAFLAAATGDDAALRREVESLLTSDTSDASFLDRLPVASASVLADPLAALTALDPAQSHTVLAAGLRVGPYEIVAPLGAGAMGEVYRACDTKLNRIVALKVLPGRFALDPDRVARFTAKRTCSRRSIIRTSAPSTGSKRRAACRPWCWSSSMARRSPIGCAVGFRSERRWPSRADCGRAGCCASEEDHPPRLEAGEHQSYTRRPREGVGLRPGESVGE